MFYTNTIDLQLLADLDTNVTTDTGLSFENKTFYDMNLIREATPNLVHAQFGQKRPIPKNGGKKIEFRRFAPLAKATTPLSEGVTPDGKKMTVTHVEAEVAQYGDYITQSDVLELTAIDNTIVEATTMLGNQAGLTLDTICRDVLNAGTSKMFCPKSDGTAVTERSGLDATCKLTVDVVDRAVTALKSVNAPKINGDYVSIIHPQMAYELMHDPKWEDWHKYTNAEAKFEGEIGKISGCRFIESTEAKIFNNGSSSAPAVYSTLFMGANAYGVTDIAGGGLQTIVKQKGSAGTADPLDQRSTIGWKAMSVTEILIEEYIIRVEGCSPTYSATAKAN